MSFIIKHLNGLDLSYSLIKIELSCAEGGLLDPIAGEVELEVVDCKPALLELVCKRINTGLLFFHFVIMHAH